MRRELNPKRTSDGRALLNVGCGLKMHWSWTNLDFSPYARLAQWPRVAKLLGAAGVLSELRRERLAKVDPEIVCWDLRRGLPFADASFDAVYHSHFLEHLDRAPARAFLVECLRVLKPGGVLRAVVPDWEFLTHAYLAALECWDAAAPDARERHDKAMFDQIDQMVRTVSGAPDGTLRRRLENRLLGGVSGRGELHKWMYDRRSLASLLENVGYADVTRETARTSRISTWESYALDLDDAGRDDRPESLYLEAIRPQPPRS